MTVAQIVLKSQIYGCNDMLSAFVDEADNWRMTRFQHEVFNCLMSSLDHQDEIDIMNLQLHYASRAFLIKLNNKPIMSCFPTYATPAHRKTFTSKQWNDEEDKIAFMKAIIDKIHS